MLDTICERLIGGESIRAMCTDPAMPAACAVFAAAAKDEEFASTIARAREAQQDAIIDEIVAMADKATVEDHQVVKLRIWARQWQASKLAPKKFGDRVTTESKVDTTVHGSLDVRVSQMSDDELARILADAAAENAPGTGGGAGVAKKKG